MIDDLAASGVVPEVPDIGGPDLAGAVIAVTGGASGIGLACATLAAAAGASVAVLDIDGTAATRAAARLFPGRPHLGLRADVTDQQALAEAARSIGARLGPVSGLITSAGRAPGGGVDTITEQELTNTFTVNVFGVVHALRAFLPDLRRRPNAAVVTVSSLSAYRGGGLVGGSVYAASKAAVVGLTRACARDLAPEGIRVNAVAPGPIDTPLIGTVSTPDRQALADATLIARIGTPEEVADAALFLLSRRSSFITGQVVHVNGGAYLG